MAALAKNSNSSIQFLWSNTNENSFSRPTTIRIHSLSLLKWEKEFERQEQAVVMLVGMFFIVANFKNGITNKYIIHRSLIKACGLILRTKDLIGDSSQLSVFRKDVFKIENSNYYSQGLNYSTSYMFCLNFEKIQDFQGFFTIESIDYQDSDSTSISVNGYFNSRKIVCI